MAAGDPKRRPIYRYGELSPDEFEELVFRLAWAEDQEVVRLRAPDGGLDTLKPHRGRLGKAEHGWQAKRHTGSIDWDDFPRSLDRAVTHWQPRGVTFVFPKDLSSTEHATFQRRLVGRHDGVEVDYYGKAALDAKLETAEGRRIAASFFEEQDARALAERMLRAGSPLSSGDDFLSAERAIGEGLSHADPDYDWLMHRVPAGLPDPPLTPATVLRLSFGTEGLTVHADLVPRHASPALQPGVTLTLESSPEGERARSWLGDLMRWGGRLALGSKAKVRLSDIPAPFDDMLRSPLEGEVMLRVVSEPAPYYGRLSAGGPNDRVAIDIDLLPAEAPEDWDAMLHGRRGGLEVTACFRFLVNQRRLETRFTLHYRASDAPHAVEAQVLRLMRAAYVDGVILLEDRTGARPAIIDRALPQRVVPRWMEVWARLHDDLAEIERAAGRPVSRPRETVTGAEVVDIGKIATRLRTGRQPVMLRDWTFTFRPSASTPDIGAVVPDARVEDTMVARVFGEEVPVARRVIQLPPMIVMERVLLSDGAHRMRFVPLGTDAAEVTIELVPLSEGGNAVDQPC